MGLPPARSLFSIASPTSDRTNTYGQNTGCRGALLRALRRQRPGWGLRVLRTRMHRCRIVWAARQLGAPRRCSCVEEGDAGLPHGVLEALRKGDRPESTGLGDRLLDLLELIERDAPGLVGDDVFAVGQRFQCDGETVFGHRGRA